MGSGKGKAPVKSVGKEKAAVKAKDKAVGKAAAMQQRTAAMAAAKPKKPAVDKPTTAPKPAGKGLAGLGKAMATKMAERKPAAKPDAGAQKANADYKAQRDSTRAEAKAKAAASKPAAPAPVSKPARGMGADRIKGIAERMMSSKKPVGSASSGVASAPAMKKGGMCKKYARGGGIEVRGKTKGKFI